MRYNKDNPLRVFEAFGGYGSQSLALKRLKEYAPDYDFKVVGYSDIEEAAIKAYMALHEGENVVNYGDISKINYDEVPDFDLFTYSFPCGLAGTLVKTLGGYRKIEDLQIGDMVLTFRNRFRMVTSTMQRNAPSYFNIDAVGCHLKLTAEHPLWVLRENKQQWVKVKDLQKSDKLSYNIPDRNIDANIENDILWLLGRYVADGWVNSHLYHSVCFAIAFKKSEEFDSHIPTYLGVKRNKKSCWEYRIADEEFQHLCLGFGNGAKHKKIPSWVFDLPVERLKVFLDGYFSGDGHVRYKKETKIQMFTTVSKELALGIQICLLKVYHKVCSLSIRQDNRKDTFNDTYNGQIAFSESTQQEIINDKCFVPIRSIEEIKGSVRVYNVSVEEDESYTCDNVNTHNCTDISAAGLQLGLKRDSNTRSSLLWECERAIEKKRPTYLLMENVAALVGAKFIKDFHEWLLVLEKYGYESFTQVLDSSKYGVPQHRERVFCVSILRTPDNPHPKYHFPRPFPLENCLADVLEENVDESYFLSDDMLARFCEKSVSEDYANQGMTSDEYAEDFENFFVAQ